MWVWTPWLWKRLTTSSTYDIFFPAVFLINRLLGDRDSPICKCYPSSKLIRKKCNNNLRWICFSIDGKRGANSHLTLCSSRRVQVLFLYECLGILGRGDLFFTFGTHLGQIFEILFRNESVSKLAIKPFITSKVKLFFFDQLLFLYSPMFRCISFFSLLYQISRSLNVSKI